MASKWSIKASNFPGILAANRPIVYTSCKLSSMDQISVMAPEVKKLSTKLIMTVLAAEVVAPAPDFAIFLASSASLIYVTTVTYFTTHYGIGVSSCSVLRPLNSSYTKSWSGSSPFDTVNGLRKSNLTSMPSLSKFIISEPRKKESD